MIKDPLAGLTVFMAVAQRRSFTAAAADLGVTASAVSQTVSALEQRLGVRLLQRTTRSVGLTEAGERFVARLRPALEEVEATFDEVNALRDRPAGVLRLNVPKVASQLVVEPMLAAFLAAYPDIGIDIVVDDGLANIIDQGCDAGIRLGETLEQEMVAVRITDREESAVVGSPAYFALRGKPKAPKDLHAHECINIRRITRGEIYKWEFTQNGRDFDVAVSGRVQCNDVDLMVRMAVDGVGLAYVLRSSVEERLADKSLIRVLQPFCPPFPGLHLYYPSRTHIAPKLQALIDFLKKRRKRSSSAI